jgi:hypothetical protein
MLELLILAKVIEQDLHLIMISEFPDASSGYALL